jgi:hypothetical protein
LIDKGAARFFSDDIVDILFGDKRYHFALLQCEKFDMSRKLLYGINCLRAIIDYTQHITKKGKFNFKTKNICTHFSADGVLTLTFYLTGEKCFKLFKKYEGN